MGLLLWSFGTAATPSRGETPSHAAEVEVWHEDLKALAARLPAGHANAFHRISAGEFEAEVAALDRRLGKMNADQFWVGLQRIESSIGDGHTVMRLPRLALRLGVQFKWFDPDYRLVAMSSDTDTHAILGAKLRAVDGSGIAEIHRELLTLTAQDEGLSLREIRAEAMLSSAVVLHGLQIATVNSAATYTLEDDSGRRFDLHVVARSERGEAGWRQLGPPPERPTGGHDQAIRCKSAGAPDVLYCDFRSYSDLEQDAQAMLSRIQVGAVKRLIVDLRDNGGGDFCKGLKYVVEPIARLSTINRPGGLFVLIGPRTFSAAMSNAAHFVQLTQATLVGQPIGERPNSYQEAEDFTLPGTGWVARYSTKFYRFTQSRENVIRPDIEIDPTWQEYERGDDPALDYIRALPVYPDEPQAWRAPVRPAEAGSCVVTAPVR